MKKYGKWALTVAAIAAIIGVFVMAVDRIKNTQDAYKRGTECPYTIIVDPGHGGTDPGAVSASGTRECDINMKIALYLREYLMGSGADVILTRGNELYAPDIEESITNDERKAKLAQECDVVVSIHLNKFSDSSVHGAECYYMTGSEEGKVLAECVQTSMKQELDSNNTRTIKAVDNLFALKANEAPSILVECGYLSNPTEEAKLKTITYQRQCAFAIYCGILKYLNQDAL